MIPGIPSIAVRAIAGPLDEYFQRTDSTGPRTFLTDALGSIASLTDSGGTLQTSYTFDPFGNTSINGSATSNSFAFTGRELDAGNLGLYFYRARYYNSQLQRFISEDPAGLVGGDVNLYAYAFGSPTNFFDPRGLDGSVRFWGGARAVGGVFEAAAGVGLGFATSWTGIGAIGGALVAAHGTDQIQAGLSQLLLGCRVDSFTSQGLQAAGLSPGTANNLDTAMSVAGSLGAGTAEQALRAGGLRNVVHYEAGSSTMSASEFEQYSGLSPVERGMQRVAAQGWWDSLMSGLKSPSQFSKTVPQGPTPLANGVGGAALGLSNMAGRGCGCAQ